MSILQRMQQHREAAREAASQTKPQDLSQGAKAQAQQAGLQLVKNEVSQGKEAGQNGHIVDRQEWKQEPATQGY